jgi:hypothetical protein
LVQKTTKIQANQIYHLPCHVSWTIGQLHSINITRYRIAIMSEIKTKHPRYNDIVEWLKKDPVCNVDGTDEDDQVTTIRTTYFEDFKIGVYLYKEDQGRIEIMSSPRLLTEEAKVFEFAGDKVIDSFQSQLSIDLLKIGIFCSIETNKSGNFIGLTLLYPLFFDNLEREKLMSAIHALARSCLITALQFDRFVLDHKR